MPDRLLLAQLASTLPLVGLIWFVQVVAYPLFASAAANDPRGFVAYHRGHSTRISYLVLPLMLVELLASAAWIAWPPAGVRSWLVLTGVALALICWLATGLLAVPRHETLARGFDARAHVALVRGNWVRTLAWTARGALLLWVTGR